MILCDSGDKRMHYRIFDASKMTETSSGNEVLRGRRARPASKLERSPRRRAADGGSIGVGEILGRLEHRVWIGFCSVLVLDRSHRTESNDSIQPPSRALIGGVQPKYGWWAPVAALYKEVGAGAHDTRFAVLPIAPPISLLI
jgi:hypothetical protein